MYSVGLGPLISDRILRIRHPILARTTPEDGERLNTPALSTTPVQWGGVGPKGIMVTTYVRSKQSVPTNRRPFNPPIAAPWTCLPKANSKGVWLDMSQA